MTTWNAHLHPSTDGSFRQKWWGCHWHGHGTDEPGGPGWPPCPQPCSDPELSTQHRGLRGGRHRPRAFAFFRTIFFIFLNYYYLLLLLLFRGIFGNFITVLKYCLADRISLVFARGRWILYRNSTVSVCTQALPQCLPCLLSLHPNSTSLLPLSQLCRFEKNKPNH